MKSGVSRRVFLSAFPAGLAAQLKQPSKKNRPLPAVGEFVRIVDPVTENVIVRLTAPMSAGILPYARNRFVSARERILLFSSNRGGSFAPYQIDLRTGAIRQLAGTDKLSPRSLCFDKTEKTVRFIDNDSLFEVGLGKGTPRKIAENVKVFANAADNSLYLIAGGKLCQLNGKAQREIAGEAADLWPQPNGRGCLFSRSQGPDECDLHYVGVEEGAKPGLVASGRIRQPFWDADGESILFLRDVTAPNGTVLAEIHGRAIQPGEEYLVSPTSQFASFAPNSDASVFVGASRSRAQPNIVLMLRTPHREMTLCEHRASHPADVSPVFSPDNRRIYFESDHEGQSALYSVNVELLVEPQPVPA